MMRVPNIKCSLDTVDNFIVLQYAMKQFELPKLRCYILLQMNGAWKIKSSLSNLLIHMENIFQRLGHR